MKDRAREVVKDSDLLDINKPFVRLTNNNTVPNLEDYQMLPEAVCELMAKAAEDMKPSDKTAGSLLGKFRSLFSK
jgi:hypothetical protein